MAMTAPIAEVATIRRESNPDQYRCSVCGAPREGRGIPAGWYWINRSRGPNRRKTCGVYCSATCMAHGMAKIERIERAIGDRFVTESLSRDMA